MSKNIVILSNFLLFNSFETFPNYCQKNHRFLPYANDIQNGLELNSPKQEIESLTSAHDLKSVCQLITDHCWGNP